VLLLVRSDLNPEPFLEANLDAELFWVTAKPAPNQEVLIGVVYRPEKGKMHSLQKICSSISATGQKNKILKICF
jgi:hypothetical protein